MAKNGKTLNNNNGANGKAQRRVTLIYNMPDANSVSVAGTFSDWQTDRYLLKKDKSGSWKTTLKLPPGRYEYRFVVDGEWRNDPNCTERTPNQFGDENCVLQV